MEIVTDSGTDLGMSAEELEDLGIHVVPLVVTLEGKTYREGVDIEPEAFYARLALADGLPTTSQPSPGAFAEVYERIAKRGSEILSIHISSGLSGTYEASQSGARLVPDAKVTHVDTKTLSAGAGWQVRAAAHAAQAGWAKDRILALIQDIGAVTESLYTLKELRYLIHGGRISHMKGLIASLLNIKPIIGVEKVRGTYVQLGQERTFKKAVLKVAERVRDAVPPGSAVQTQVLHANNAEGAALLRDHLDRLLDCSWLPLGSISLVLGAHTGPSMVGVAYGPLEAFAAVP
jgi:DegV family protein with EDD domain